LTNDAWIAGVPKASLDVNATVPNATVIVELWDVDASGAASRISLGAGRTTTTGAQT
jgi:predicted acyl esterase